MKGKFVAAVNCMDGRVQLPVIRYLKRRFKAEYVDMITEPGPAKALSWKMNRAALESVRRRVRLSLLRHNACAIAVVGHHDCAGNPVPARRQHRDIVRAVEVVRSWKPGVPVIGLWVDRSWKVRELGRRG